MYMSAERFALANQAVRETFAQCSIVWQSIPHWDVGDPGQITVADGKFSLPALKTSSISGRGFRSPSPRRMHRPPLMRCSPK